MSEKLEFNVVIGVQARSNSSRLPNKISKRLGSRSIIYHVINNCRSSLGYINAYTHKSGINVKLVVVAPDEDPIISKLRGLDVVTGPEENVLTRYGNVFTRYNPDFLVRITADCPLLPPYLITKTIYTGVKGNYDYLSNTDERFRTFADGYDVEFISRRAFVWADRNSVEAYDREHVTPILRREPPNEFKLGHIIGHLDLSACKLSLDTPEDYDTIRYQYESVNKKLKRAREHYGDQNTHRF